MRKKFDIQEVKTKTQVDKGNNPTKWISVKEQEKQGIYEKIKYWNHTIKDDQLRNTCIR